MRDYAGVSYWLETCGDDLTPRPPVDGNTSVDVAILGGGYTGLWTAYYLLRAHPDIKVAIVEGEICGFGASGRNGAWCAPGLNITLGKLERLHGHDAARRQYLAVSDAIDEVGRVATAENIDIEWRRGGELIVARGPHEDPQIEDSYRELERFDLAGHYKLLNATELEARICVGGATGALYTPDAATIQPAMLARGLARTVERMGATIYEQTPVSDFRHRSPSNRPALLTPNGYVSADAIVLAGEAYLTRLRQLHRSLIPVYSLIVLTEPLSEDAWAEIGWGAHELLGFHALHGRLPVTYRRRATAFRWARCAIPLWLAHPRRVRPARTHPRCLARPGPRVVPGAARLQVHSLVGRAGGYGPRLAPNDQLRRGLGSGQREGIHRSWRVDGQPRRSHSGRAGHRPGNRADFLAPGEPQVTKLGARTLPLDGRPFYADGTGPR